MPEISIPTLLFDGSHDLAHTPKNIFLAIQLDSCRYYGIVPLFFPCPIYIKLRVAVSSGSELRL